MSYKISSNIQFETKVISVKLKKHTATYHVLTYLKLHPVLLTANYSCLVVPKSYNETTISHSVYTFGKEAGVDLVLIEPFLLSTVNHVVLMLNSIFKHNFHKKGKSLVSKQGQPQPHVQSKAGITVK